MDEKKENVTEPLVQALLRRERLFAEAVDMLRRLVEDNGDGHAAEGAARSLREAVELVRCLRRLVGDRTVTEIHKAFGAPGDFGYGTPIGAALARVYGLR